MTATRSAFAMQKRCIETTLADLFVRQSFEELSR
jgi:hypothetical protein